VGTADIAVFTAAYNFQIALALIASQTLAGGGQIYRILMTLYAS